MDERTARALGVPSRDCDDVAHRLAKLADARPPTRPETQEFLVQVLLHAVRKIPSSGAAWSWGEFHNGGLTPLSGIAEDDDWRRLMRCAIDLGLDEKVPATRSGSIPTPREALVGNLVAATEHMLRAVRGLLEAAGVSPYGESSSGQP